LCIDSHNHVNSAEQNNHQTTSLLEQQIYQAFNEGRLYFRSISPVVETKYFKQKNKNPRPMYLVAPKIPAEMRNNEESNFTVGIINAKPLFSYKENAMTRIIVNGGGPDIYVHGKRYKCLADSKSLLNKQYELASRRWEVYQRATSGHLQADGSFSLPKFKQNITSGYTIPHSEELKSEYNLEQIKCDCVEEYSNQKITKILASKKQLEQALNITELPIVSYSEKHGSIKVIFEKEINIDQLKENENKIEYLYYLSGIDIYILNFKMRVFDL
jgi:hypothetical protein